MPDIPLTTPIAWKDDLEKLAEAEEKSQVGNDSSAPETGEES